MPGTSRLHQRKGLVAIDGAMGLMALLLIVQVWLLTAALEAFLGGHREAALPAAVVSGVIVLGCVGLTLFVNRGDQAARRRS
jgi:predicted Co/Zn/Cd cation transporter (cation efflux family)